MEISNYIPCGVALYSLSSREPIFMNAELYKLIGYTEDEYKSSSVSLHDIMSPENESVSAEKKKIFLKTGESHGDEYRLVKSTGELRRVRLELLAMTIEGSEYALAVLSDISGEKEIAEQMTLVTENIGRSLSLMRIKDGREELVYGNSAFFSNVGITSEHYGKGSSFFSRANVSGGDYQQVIDASRKACETGKPVEFTHRQVCPDGRILWLHRRFAAIKQDAPGCYLLVSVVTNVTAEHEARIEAELEQGRFQTVISELSAAVFEWNRKTNAFYSSEAYEKYALSELNNEDILMNHATREVVHPDDIETLNRFFEDSDKGLPRTETTLRLKMKDGTFRWCRMIGFFYKDENGTPSRTIGVIIDINDEHERSFMLGNLLNEIPGGVAIFMLGEKTECRYFTDGFAKLSGRSREEINELQRNGNMLEAIFAPADYERFSLDAKKALAAGEPLNGTYRYVTKGHEFRWVHLSATKMREEDGASVYYCVCTSPTDETALYRSIVEDSAIGVIVADRNTRNVLYMNELAAKIAGFASVNDALGHSLIDTLKMQGKEPLLTLDDIRELKTDSYTETAVERNGKYYAIKSKALVWN